MCGVTLQNKLFEQNISHHITPQLCGHGEIASKKSPRVRALTSVRDKFGLIRRDRLRLLARRAAFVFF
jgi:hypothetical protein